MWQEIAGKSVVLRPRHGRAHPVVGAVGLLCAIVENMVSGESQRQHGRGAGRGGSPAGRRHRRGERGDARGAGRACWTASPATPTPRRVSQAAPPSDAAALAAGDARAGAAASSSSSSRHGHRGYRELCMRDPSWGDDPTPLIQSMQAAVHARLAHRRPPRAAPTESRLVRARAAGCAGSCPGRTTPSVAASTPSPSWWTWPTASSRRFATSATQMAAEGHLPDADLVYFFTTGELSAFIAAPDARRVAQLPSPAARPSSYQQRLRVPGDLRGPARAARAAAGRSGRWRAAGPARVTRRRGGRRPGGAHP